GKVVHPCVPGVVAAATRCPMASLVKGDDPELPGQLDPGDIPFALAPPESVDQDHRRSAATPVAHREQGTIADKSAGNGHDPSVVDQLDPLDGLDVLLDHLEPDVARAAHRRRPADDLAGGVEVHVDRS